MLPALLISSTWNLYCLIVMISKLFARSLLGQPGMISSVLAVTAGQSRHAAEAMLFTSVSGWQAVLNSTPSLEPSSLVLLRCEQSPEACSDLQGSALSALWT